MRSIGFASFATIALALGIGTTVAVFSIADAALLKPITEMHPEDLVWISGSGDNGLSPEDFDYYRIHNKSLSGLAAFSIHSVSLRIDTFAEAIPSQSVSGNFFDVMGVPIVIGRAILGPDDAPAANGVVVISDNFWRTRLRADRRAIGRLVDINGNDYQIIGVTPASFRGPVPSIAVDMWVPANGPGQNAKNNVFAIGRIRAGNSIDQVRAEFLTLKPGLESPDQRLLHQTRVSPAVYGPPNVTLPILGFATLLLCLAIVVLAIVSVNVAILLMARYSSRRREVNVRFALGATRHQVVRQFLWECVLLSILGCVLSIPILAITLRLTPRTISAGPFSFFIEPTLDWNVFLFQAAIAIAATLMCGLAPALEASKANIISTLKEGESIGSPKGSHLQSALVIAQVAMSTLLLLLAISLNESLSNVAATHSGLDVRQVMVGDVAIGTLNYSSERVRALLEDVLGRIKTTPGVTEASIGHLAPLRGFGSITLINTDSDKSPIRVGINWVSEGHLRTLTIPLHRGRDFNRQDYIGSQDVAIVNETLARRLWPSEDSLGRRFYDTDRNIWVEIVGIAADSHYGNFDKEPQPLVLRPIWQYYSQLSGTALFVKVNNDSIAVMDAIRSHIHAVDRNVPLTNVQRLESAMALKLVPARVLTTVAGALGVVALILATIGVYGVMSYIIRQRMREIGVRIALGANPSRITILVVRRALLLTALGTTVGVLGALVSVNVLSSFFNQLNPASFALVVSVASLLLAAAFAGSYFPARRASKIDPLIAIRV